MSCRDCGTIASSGPRSAAGSWECWKRPNRDRDKGFSGSDVPHHLVVTLLYELPRLRNNRILGTTLGGWKLGVLETAESGAPFTVITAAKPTKPFPPGRLR